MSFIKKLFGGGEGQQPPPGGGSSQTPARALVLEPSLIVCDESVAALDVSIQADMLNLFADLQREFSLTYLFISHDLRVVAHVSDRVAVMYCGRLMELGPAGAVMASPLHPYTQALLSAEPEPAPANRRSRHRIILKGEVPSPIAPPTASWISVRRRRVETSSVTATRTGIRIRSRISSRWNV